MSKRRVVITGLGCIAPNGNSVNEFWHALTSGVSGLGTITRFNPLGLPAQSAGEITDFCPEKRLTPRNIRRMDRVIQLGMCSGLEAFDDSGIQLSDKVRERVGVLIGAGIGGIETIENTTIAMSVEQKKVSPFYIPSSIINMVSGDLSIELGLKGPNLAITTACTTGTHCIGIAARLIAYGDADIMIAGGTEASVTPSTVAGFTAARALSSNNKNPKEASRPFDRDRDGFVLGEGSGAVVLEELDSAKSRGARIYAELAGFGMSADANHMTQPSPGGEGAARCMYSAMKDGSINPEEVDYINAHGTSTPLGDVAETLAIKQCFHQTGAKLAISSNKSMIGHLLGAAGGVEAVATVLSIYYGVVPPTINLDNPDPECDLDYVPHNARETKIKTALSNSFGFGGTNGTLAFRSFAA
ncbi:MAG: beta-ketoacyl-[acyl-carrier-protein] synthase II [Acidiferrobacteraceae bacterium]|nr:beta-ketoacyl-[acyl-carrier-protein] synthase II [Acidiferrobacteraceae bacterium]